MIAPAIAVACFGWATIIVLAIEIGKQPTVDTSNVVLGYATAILLVLFGTLLLVGWLLT